ncbi:MAG: deoxyribonuclease IV, partial [Candidatus Acidiferrum sp.]
PQQAVATIIESVKQAARRVPLGGLEILIENTAGMGNAVGSRLEEVADIVAGLNSLPVGACLDTAHLFAAGYDIRTEAGLASTIGHIESTIGLDRVPVFHVNDSKIPLGGRVDRHEHIGMGKIGAEAFERILRHPRLAATAPGGLPGRAFILETPIDEPGDDRRNVAKLWELAGLAQSAPPVETGFSMLTTAIKKQMVIQRKAEKKRKDAAEAQNSQRHEEKKTPSMKLRARTNPSKKSKARKKGG